MSADHRRDWQCIDRGREGYDGVHAHEAGRLVWYHDSPYNNQDSAGLEQSLHDFLVAGPPVHCPSDVQDELVEIVRSLAGGPPPDAPNVPPS